MSDRPTNPETGRAKLRDDEELPPEAPSGWVNKDYDDTSRTTPKRWIQRAVVVGFLLYGFYVFAGEKLIGLFK